MTEKVLQSLFSNIKDDKVFLCIYCLVKLESEYKGKVESLSQPSNIKKVITAAERLVSVMREMDVNVTEEVLSSYLKWHLLEKGKSFLTAYKYVMDFLYYNSLEREHTEDDPVLNEFVDSYIKYVKTRYKIEPKLNKFDLLTKEAALTTKSLADEFGISMYDCLKFQHECWEKIKLPLSLKSLADRNRAERRLRVYLEKREGEVIKKRETRSETSYVEKRWREVLSMGPKKFVSLCQGGFLKEVAERFVSALEKAKSKEERQRLLAEFSPENVGRLWLQKGKPVLFF